MASKKIFTQFIFILSLFAIEQVHAATYEVVNDTSSSASTSTYTLTASKIGTGTGIILGIDSATTVFSTTTSITLTAQASSGSTFAGWSNTCGTTTTCTLLMNTDRSISATFNLTSSSGGGSVSTGGGGNPTGAGAGSVSSNKSAALPGAYYNSNNVGLGTTGTVGTVAAQSYIFKADLKLMQRHPEVIKLQQFLNNRGYLISTQGSGSKGLESDYFGLTTKSALARFQADNKIIPSEGFFGNLTKAFMNRMNPTTPNQLPVKTQNQTQTQTQTAATPGKYIFTKKLTLNSRDAEVIKLQQFLNGKGYIISTKGNGSPGLESNYFGTATQVALARWQKDNGITPSTGYFGNITRQFLNR